MNKIMIKLSTLILPLLLLGASPLGAALSPKANTQCVTNALAGGTPDAITISNLPCTPTTSTIYVTTIGANISSAVTIQIIGQGAPQPVVRADNSPVQPGDFPPAGGVVQLINNGSKWILLPGASGTCFFQVNAGGTADAITIPQQGCIPTRQMILIKSVGANVTTAPTLAEGTLPPAVIVNTNGTALTPGSIPGPNTFALLSFNGINWILMSGVSGGGGNVVGTGITNNVAIWTGVSNLGSGLPYGTRGNSLLLETLATGFIDNSVLSNIPSSALANTGVGAGIYVDPSITVNSQGQVTAITSGVAVNTGTTGGLPYYSGPSTLSATGALASNVPIIMSGGIPTTATRSGSTTVYATISGTLVNGQCVSIDASLNLVAAGGACSVGGGGGTVSTGSINQLAYYAANGTVVSGLATCASGVYGTTAGSVPQCETTLASGLTIPSPVIATITNTGTISVPTTTGTLLESAGPNTVSGTLNVSGTFQIAGVTLALPVSVANGGTGLTTIPTNDIPYGAGTSPASLITPANNAVLCYSAGGIPSACATLPVAAMPTVTLTGAVTGAGTNSIATSYPSEAANLFLAGPTTGAAAVATFRGIVPADLTTALLTPPPIGTTTPAAIAASTLSATGILTTNVTGSTQCLQANSAGQVSGSGQICGGAGNILNSIPMLSNASSFGSV